MNIHVLSKGEIANSQSHLRNPIKVIDISLLCDKEKLKDQKARIWYFIHSKTKRKMLLLDWFGFAGFKYDDPEDRNDKEIAFDFNHFAGLVGIETKTLWEIIKRNGPW